MWRSRGSKFQPCYFWTTCSTVWAKAAPYAERMSAFFKMHLRSWETYLSLYSKTSTDSWLWPRSRIESSPTRAVHSPVPPCLCDCCFVSWGKTLKQRRHWWNQRRLSLLEQLYKVRGLTRCGTRWTILLKSLLGEKRKEDILPLETWLSIWLCPLFPVFSNNLSFTAAII